MEQVVTKKRGRKPGSKNKPKEEKVVLPIPKEEKKSEYTLMRLINQDQIKVLEDDLAGLYKLYESKSGEASEQSGRDFLDYIAFCNLPHVYLYVALDDVFKARGYFLAHVIQREGGKLVLFIRQICIDPTFRFDSNEALSKIEQEALKSYKIEAVEITTKRNDDAYDRWSKQFGFERDCTLYKKVIKNG